MERSKPKGIVVFGGGTATNSLVDIFSNLRESRNCSLSYIIPISDNGGSSSELIRVFGGPGIGDVRSRLVRLIPSGSKENADASLSATKALFNHRLSSDANAARAEWLDIVDGRHELWASISSEKRELIRSFFNLVNMEIVKRARPSSTFDFGNAAVGNLFLTSARIFSGSLESAIYLLGQICAVPHSTQVLPAINSNFTHHISAELADGTVITGQNAISHPDEPTSLPDLATTTTTATATTTTTSGNREREATDAHDLIEDANLPGSLPTLRRQYIHFSKAEEADLPARIRRVWYINPYGHEMRPRANAKVVTAVADAGAVVYSIGSLWTSLVPSLLLRGVGAAVGANHVPKVLILNASIDRETGPSVDPYSAVDFLQAIAAALRESRDEPDAATSGHGAAPAPAPPVVVEDGVRPYITHIIYLEGEGTPKVDKEALRALGVEPVRVYGRRVDGMWRYDEGGLERALEAVVGSGGRRDAMGRSRRNTKQ